MLVSKSCYLNITSDIDVLPIIHDVQLALREFKAADGLLLLYVPDAEGALLKAREGFEKDRRFKNWLKAWLEAKKDAPEREFFGYLLASQMTLPVLQGKILGLDPWHHLFLLDFKTEAGRRELGIAYFTESPKQEPKKGAGRR